MKLYAPIPSCTNQQLVALFNISGAFFRLWLVCCGMPNIVVVVAVVDVVGVVLWLWLALVLLLYFVFVGMAVAGGRRGRLLFDVAGERVVV